MKLYRDQGVVLRKKPLGEKDELVIMLTKHQGKQAFMSYGSRDPRSRKSGLLELSNEVLFQAREGKALPTLQQVQMITSRGFDTVESDDSLQAFYRVAEILKLTDRLIQEDQQMSSVYQDLNQALSLHAQEGVVEMYWVRLLDDLGFLADWKRCATCDEGLSPTDACVFSTDHRGFEHQRCSETTQQPVELDLLKVMNYLQKTSLPEASRLQVEHRSLRRIRDCLESLTVEH